ncbi:DEAD/DEAH box helicase [Ectopseudomonas alcaliphila]|uniref:DEAD/DEAH box helicase n=1 Tax=Ectopseudomonas alcaliphila TaxID=101564 RepID=UPI002785EB4C|nr:MULTISPECIES: DEAD/DEAH box helicase [Pseudomonas]MDP9941246.1 helicase [Pseudomonas sp. 3400]MDR7013465.1 helicase [Pseudomonas alcaliphila]
MDVRTLTGPGVTPWIIEQLLAWGITNLTDVQLRAIEAGVANNQSMVVSAPTSSGKTLIGEIAVLSALHSSVRAIYLVSHKALADQKYQDFLGRFGEQAETPIATVGLNTGDRTEGEANAQVMVATYEKALGLFISGQIRPGDALVVADELQIIGEVGRGPDIEILVSALRQIGMRQFVALTATTENSHDLADWMNCKLVRSLHRDVPLLQEVWWGNQAFRTKFGDSEGQASPDTAISSQDISNVVDKLLELKRGPVLVFTESRREALNMATAYSRRRPRGGDGIELVQQLELFSEPTESSDQLRDNAERRVTFHTADLSPQERQVIENGITGHKFDVCFATSTLAAGVNFPFRTIVFPKLTYQWGDRAGTMLTRSDYRNMSGRAGRLGMHQDGFSVLLPRNGVELTHANMLVMPENDRLESQLVNLSLSKTLLMLVASGIARSPTELISFFRNSLYWHQTLNRNPKKLEELDAQSVQVIDWLVQNGMFKRAEESLSVTPLGSATAATGLLPSSAAWFADFLRHMRERFTQNFESWIPCLIYVACACDEFRAKRPSRFLPFPTKSSYDSITFWTTQQLSVDLDRMDVRLAQCAHAIALYVEGTAERHISFATKISSGQINRLAIDVAWVLDGLHKLSTVTDLEIPQASSNQLAMLARRVRWGAPVQALDVLRVAERHGVPGLGRQRVMGLLAQGIATVHDVLATAKDKLVSLLRSEQRASALLYAAANTAGLSPARLTSAQLKLGQDLGLEELIVECNDKLGVDYEKALLALLQREFRWSLTVLDDGIRQNVPDLLIKMPGIEILLECKTCTKSPPLIKKEEAWAVIQKAADYAPSMRRVTLGKPAFDETSKSKAAASQDITLVEHSVFIEGVLRVHSGSLAPEDFLSWLSAPGVAEIERLPGEPSYRY